MCIRRLKIKKFIHIVWAQTLQRFKQCDTSYEIKTSIKGIPKKIRKVYALVGWPLSVFQTAFSDFSSYSFYQIVLKLYTKKKTQDYSIFDFSE